jgi:hypothetical protein
LALTAPESVSAVTESAAMAEPVSVVSEVALVLAEGVAIVTPLAKRFLSMVLQVAPALVPVSAVAVVPVLTVASVSIVAPSVSIVARRYQSWRRRCQLWLDRCQPWLDRC